MIHAHEFVRLLGNQGTLPASSVDPIIIIEEKCHCYRFEVQDILYSGCNINMEHDLWKSIKSDESFIRKFNLDEFKKKLIEVAERIVRCYPQF